MKKIKIAVICNYKIFPERVGGMDYFFWMFDQQCKEKNIEVHWFFPNSSNHGGYKSLNIFFSKFVNVENYFLNHFAKNKYNIVFTHFVELCTPFFKKLKKISSSKVIAVDHNPRPIEGYPLKKRIEKRLKGFFYSKYIDLFIGVSSYCIDQLLKDFGFNLKNKSYIIFNGIEVGKYLQKNDFEIKRKLIVASHLRKEKGIQDLILAIKELVKQKEVCFTIDIYGDGPFKSELLQLIADHNLSACFNFKGSVSNLYEHYCNYDFLIHPSHGETFCFSVLESLMCNLPVVTTSNQGNILGLIKDNQNGFLYEAGNIEQLKTILMHNIEKPLQFENQAIVKIFSLEKMVANYMNLVI
jgi:glycosyltransferase involved in cell wall biosynthesis